MLNMLFTLAICNGGQDLTCFYNQIKPSEKKTLNYCMKRGECNGRQDLQKN